MKLSEILKQYRNEKNISLRDFAKKSNLSRSYISILENDNMKNPSLSALERLSKAMEITLDELLEKMDNTSVSLSTRSDKDNCFLADLELSSWIGNMVKKDDEELYSLLKIISNLDNDKIKTLLVMAKALDK
ncbi:MAG: helix-turn-helix transcriptional regulator [Bacilli bacterium]|nr:helix-turn-helix transcriptional regulator [Bacilli bacterium]